MVRTVDLFLDSDRPLDGVADHLAELSGCRFVASPDYAYFVVRHDEVVAYLSGHDFIDDDDLPLSEFRYVLSTPVRRGGVIEGGPELSFLRPWRLGPVWAAVSVANLWAGMHRFRAGGGPGALPPGLTPGRLGAEFARWARLTATGERTLLHGDPHPANTYALPGGRTGFYDWQLARTGHWSHDVGYFLVGSLSIDDRREHERRLLAGYLDALGSAHDPAGAWDRYRASPAFGLATWLHTLSFGTFQPVELCLEMAARYAAAYVDLDTGAADSWDI